MKLFEFDSGNSLRIKLVAVTNHLKAEVEHHPGSVMSTDELIDLLRKNDITIDKSDLFDIVTKDPLRNIIKNINGDEIVFKGQASTDTETDTEMGEPQTTDTQKTLSSMAKRAMK